MRLFVEELLNEVEKDLVNLGESQFKLFPHTITLKSIPQELSMRKNQLGKANVRLDEQ